MNPRDNMRRGIFCQVVDVDPNYFKTLRTRDQLAFASNAADPAEAKMHGNREWERFTLRDALALRLQLDAMAEGGVSPALAVSAIGGNAGFLDGAFEAARDANQPDLFLGIEQNTEGRGHYVDTLANIALRSERDALELRKMGGDRTRLILVNVSRAARFVEQRARELGAIE